MPKKKTNPPTRKSRRRYVPPAFFVMLAVSFTMWWLTQLGKSYSDVEIPIEVKVEGNIFNVRFKATGVGYSVGEFLNS